MANPTDAIDLDLSPADYAVAAAQPWVFKTNDNPAYGISDANVRAVVEWANRVDDVERRIQARLTGSFINALEIGYGVAGDGATDDTAALQAVIDEGVSRNIPVYVPPGSYSVTSSLLYDSRLTIFGAGKRQSTLVYSGTGYCFTRTGTSANEDILFRDFGITYGAASDGGVYVYNVVYSAFLRLSVIGDAVGHGNCMALSGNAYGACRGNIIDHCYLTTSLNGVSVTGSSTLNWVRTSRFASNTVGVYMYDAPQTRITDNLIDLGTTGLSVEGSTSGYQYAHNIIINGNSIDAAATPIAVVGTAANITNIQIRHNVSRAGSALSATLWSTTNPSIGPNKGGLGEASVESSPLTTGPIFQWWGTAAVDSVARISRQSASGVGATLQLANGVGTNNALSVGTWAGSTYTQTAYWTAAGNITAVDGTFSGTVSGTWSGAISLATGTDLTLGGGTSGGSSRIISRHNNSGATLWTIRAGTSSSSDRFSWYSVITSNTLEVRTYSSGGSLLAIRPFSITYTGVTGTSHVQMPRIAIAGGTALAYPTHITLSAGWGSTATATVDYGTANNAQITITPGGTGIAANPTVTLTDPEGSWSGHATMAMRNGGTDAAITGFSVDDTTSASQTIFTMVGTPDGGTYILRWVRFGT